MAVPIATSKKGVMGFKKKDMKKFEYKIEGFFNVGPTSLVSKLNALGLLGWELVNVESGEYVFKREIT